MAKTIEVGQDQIDVLTRQIVELNKNIKQNQLDKLYTEVLNSKEAAAYLKISEKSLERLRNAKEFKYIQRGTLIRYRRSELDKWINSYQVGK
jgi:excisionase family DNA binding protein